jgi:deoxyribonuclease V
MTANIGSKFRKNLNTDLYRHTWSLTEQVPRGRVTTYGAIARALGDIRASRAVGIMEHVNPRPIIVPCHRVVYSDGSLGGYGSTEGVPQKVRLLREEGINIKNGKIENFKDVFFNDFKTTKPKPLELLRMEQDELQKQVTLEDALAFEDIKTIAGVDVSYSYENGFGAAVVVEVGSLKMCESVTTAQKVMFPYIPTYLSYHELPIAISLLEKLQSSVDVILFDGNGVLHPNRLGLATHGGILLQRPSLGIAKSLLCGEAAKKKFDNDLIATDIVEIHHEKQLIGYGYRPKTAKKKYVYVSPGNSISFETSLKVAQTLCKTRVPEPIKLAHELALKLKREYEKKDKK